MQRHRALMRATKNQKKSMPKQEINVGRRFALNVGVTLSTAGSPISSAVAGCALAALLHVLLLSLAQRNLLALGSLAGLHQAAVTLSLLSAVLALLSGAAVACRDVTSWWCWCRVVGPIAPIAMSCLAFAACFHIICVLLACFQLST